MAADQCIQPWRHGRDKSLNFKRSIRTGRRGGLSDFEGGMVVGARQAPLSISEAAVSEILSEQQSCGRKGLVDVRGQRRMGRLVPDDRQATLWQMQKCITQHMET